METVLEELELDVRELKYLLDLYSREPNTRAREILSRRIKVMQSRLDKLLLTIENIPAEINTIDCEDVALVDEPGVTAEVVMTVDMPEQCEEIEANDGSVEVTLAERIKSAGNIKDSFSLNDSFRFSRELFDGDMERMNDVLTRISDMYSLDEVISYIYAELQTGEEEEAFVDFMDIIRKYFA